MTVQKALAIFVVALLAALPLPITAEDGDPLHSPFVSYLQIPLVACTDGTTGVALVHLPTSNAPAPSCVTAAGGVVLAALDFDPATVETIQFMIWLPPDWKGAIDMEARWRGTATTGNLILQTETACGAAGEDENLTWDTLESWPADAADAQADDWGVAKITGMDVSTCAADEFLHVRFGRDADNAGDTINSNDARVSDLRVWIRSN